MIVTISNIPCRCSHSHSFRTQYFTILNFIQNIITINISWNNRISLYGFFYWILLQIFLGMSCTYIFVITSRHGWIILRVGTMIVCFSGFVFNFSWCFLAWIKYIVLWQTIHQQKELVHKFLYCFVACMPLRWIE